MKLREKRTRTSDLLEAHGAKKRRRRRSFHEPTPGLEPPEQPHDAEDFPDVPGNDGDHDHEDSGAGSGINDVDEEAPNQIPRGASKEVIRLADPKENALGAKDDEGKPMEPAWVTKEFQDMLQRAVEAAVRSASVGVMGSGDSERRSPGVSHPSQPNHGKTDLIREQSHEGDFGTKSDHRNQPKWQEPTQVSQVSLGRGPSLKSPAKYSGGLDLEEFMQDYLSVAAVSEWPPKTTRLMLRHYMEGPAKDLYNDWANEVEESGQSVADIPIDVIAARLEQTFVSQSAKERARRQLSRCRREPHETILEFHARFKRSARYAAVPDDDVLAAQFVRATGLRFPNPGFTRVKDAVEVARSWEDVGRASDDDDLPEARQKHSKDDNLNSTSDQEHGHNALQTAKRTTPKVIAAIQASQADSQDSRGITTSALLDSSKCAICHKSNHSATNCWRLLGAQRGSGSTQQRSPLANSGQYGPMRSGGNRGNLPKSYQQYGQGEGRRPPPICYGCNEPGHIRRNCPREQCRICNIPHPRGIPCREARSQVRQSDVPRPDQQPKN